MVVTGVLWVLEVGDVLRERHTASQAERSVAQNTHIQFGSEVLIVIMSELLFSLGTSHLCPTNSCVVCA